LLKIIIIEENERYLNIVNKRKQKKKKKVKNQTKNWKKQ